MGSCDVCNSTFTTETAAKQHKKDTGHCVCQHCHKIVATSKGLQSHHDAVHCQSCPECSRTFITKMLLNDHKRSQHHCYCGDCNRFFGTNAAFRAHLQSPRHPTEFRCCDCDRQFPSAAALDQHLRDKIHRRPVTIAGLKPKTGEPKRNSNGRTGRSKIRCSECPRTFETKEALAQHRTSRAHRPLGKLACFAGVPCNKRFQSPSAALNHLESGACISGFDGDRMRALIMKHDAEGLITRRSPPDARSLMETSANEYSDISRSPSSLTLSSTVDGCLTPASGSLSDWVMLVSQSPTRRCPFCPPERRPFQDARALRQHIESVAHNDPFLYCPVRISGGEHGLLHVVRQFKTVGALAQHVESGACGATTFWKVVKYVEECCHGMGYRLKLVEGDRR